MQATKLGTGLLSLELPPFRQVQQGWNDVRQSQREALLQAKRQALQQGVCQCASHMKYELGLAAMAMADRGLMQAGPKGQVPEELIGQAIKEVTMHEVGHTLGLRHNFKASTMLKNEQLHDTNITRKRGLVGSVMDYAPVNLAPKGVKQGDYFTSTIGPYDYWAIEYGYKPLSGGSEGEYDELKKVANRGAGPGLDYATDEDLYGSADPLVHVWDLGNDPLKFATERMALADEMLKGLSDRVVDKGDGYQRVRMAFGMLLGQYGNAAYLASSYVGGEAMHRDHAGDPNGRDPFVPVNSAKQREALKLLQERILSDKSFQFPPQLLRRLAADRWRHWGNEGAVYGGVDYPVHQRVLRIQRIVLAHMLHPATLARLQNTALKVEKAENPVTIAEVFRSLTDGIWSELPEKPDAKPLAAGTSIRRNLQREHLKELTNLVLGKRAVAPSGFVLMASAAGSVPPDARSLARMHLRDIQKRITLALSGKEPVRDDTTRAHLEECQERIAKVLGASMQVNEP